MSFIYFSIKKVITDFGNEFDSTLLPAIEYNINYVKSLGVTVPIKGLVYSVIFSLYKSI